MRNWLITLLGGSAYSAEYVETLVQLVDEQAEEMDRLDRTIAELQKYVPTPKKRGRPRKTVVSV